MLEAFRILEEDKGIKKEDIIEAVTESLRSAYKRRYGQAESAAKFPLILLWNFQSDYG